ncbi:MAG TPA: SMC family ATPase [Dehalococcoidia bacterium]|nr:SMC family ATPase [Dehalococcoidia bacterium]
MIPVKLSLKNFMCYRDNVPPLSFDSIHVACLCGDNGNGKSAIFDAMTWALWGKSRAKSDDDLIHLGQSEMEVELEFVAGEQQYRVLRKRAKPTPSRPGQTVLELQISSNGDFISITGNTLTETQQRIIGLLRLDYQTFINSAFLLQGHADEFSIKRPGERKEILANILDLSRYDELEKRSKNLAGDRRSEAERLESAIAEIRLQLAHKGEYEDEIENVQHDISQVEKRKKATEAITSTLRQQKESLELRKEQLSNTEVHLSQTKQELERWQEKVREHKAKIADYEQVLAGEATIRKGYSELTEMKELNDESNQKLSQLLGLREHVNNLEKVIEQAAKALTIEHELTQARVAEREAKFNRIPQLEEALVQARNRLIELTKLEESVAERRRQAQQITSRLSYLESTSAQLEREITDLKEKLRLLAQGNVRCPLCETELGVDGRQRIETKLTSEAEDKTKGLQSSNEEISKRRLELWALENELTQKESVVSKEQVSQQSQLSIIEKELAEARQAGKELVQERDKLEELEQCLLRKDYAIYEQQTLWQLQKEEEKLGYDKERHEHLKQQLVKLQKYESLKQELDEAGKAIDKEKTTLAESEEAVSNLSVVMEADLKKRDDLRTEIAVLPDVADKLAKAEEDYQTLLKHERQVRDKLAALQERLRHLAELDVSKQEKKKLLHRILEEEGVYKELAEAFSKKGVQALLIERALPEIEIEANRLLSRMTDNRMSLTLESQRETKKGDTIETLDIKIADELGTRNYEMYSGGEAFRIDLALRIALSRLLVRRAGASLPILIIDEGFGTQDSSGRERLVEAINSIQNDFEKIIVITHLEELKDRFPVLINVTRTASGSVISVS